MSSGELAAAAQLTGVWTEDCADQFRATGKRLNESLNVWLVRRVRLWRRSRLGGGEASRRLVEQVGILSAGFQLAHYELSSADRESADTIERPPKLLNLD